MLHVQHPREQGKWLYEGFDVIICPVPEGAGQTTPEQPGHYAVIKTTTYETDYSHPQASLTPS